MQVNYEIGAEDFVAFNLHYARGNVMVQQNVLRMRLVGTGLILAGGMVVTFLQGAAAKPFLIWPIFGLCAALYFLLMPRSTYRKMEKGVRKMVEARKQNGIVGQKTMTLKPDGVHLTGEGEDSFYAYDRVERVVQDAQHYYVFVGPMEALILPFRAFADEAAREAYWSALCQRVQKAGGRLQEE